MYSHIEKRLVFVLYINCTKTLLAASFISLVCLLNVNVQVRLFVTHGLSFLPQCDQVVVITEGIISEVSLYGC